jgi:serine/threonine-protein kinase
MAAVSLGLPLAIGALLSQMYRLPVSLINIPNRAYWLAPERADASRQYIARHGNVFMALLVAFMCFVHWQVVDANRTQPPRLEEGAFIAGLVLFLVASVVWAGILYARFRVPRT